MLARAEKSGGKYSKLVTLLTTLVLVMSGLVLSPAHAVADGTVNCETSGTFTITNNVVGWGGSCAGAVVIPEGVTSIGDFAFSEADLASITIPAGVTSIGDYAFVDATALTTVTFVSGSQLESIGDYAFYGAAKLTSITIPAGVTSIGDYAFVFTPALTSITVDSNSQSFTSIDGVLFNKDAKTLITYPVGKTETSYAIPASVTSIGDAAFFYATALTGITVAGANPNYSSAAGVLFNKLYKTLIAYPAGKSGTSYTIPAGVTSIGYAAFAGATSLETVTFESGSQLSSIGGGAFAGATSLTSITIPASVTNIGEFAFVQATAIASVYFLGDAPTNVGEQAFYSVASGAKAYIKSGATGFNLDTDGDGNSGVWYGLIVTVGFYTVTYNTSGGSAVAAQNYVANFPAPTSPTRTGYTFVGWSATAGGLVITFPNTPALASDITLYAKWTRNSAKAAARVKPTVSGTPKVSKTLTAKKGTWSGHPTPVFTYQWYACTKKVTAAKATVPTTCKKITGATKSTLKLAKAQKGKFIAVLVTGKGTGTTATKWLSKSTAIVK